MSVPSLRLTVHAAAKRRVNAGRDRGKVGFLSEPGK
jgi:hypothetical protein